MWSRCFMLLALSWTISCSRVEQPRTGQSDGQIVDHDTPRVDTLRVGTLPGSTATRVDPTVTRDRSALRITGRASVDTAPVPALEAMVAMTNHGSSSVQFEYGACALQVWAYAGEQRDRRPAWRSERRAPPGSEVGYACPSYLTSRVIAPGESFSPDEFGLRVPIRELLADSLPAGVYHLRAGVELLWDTVRVVDGLRYGDQQNDTVWLDLGSVYLPRP